MSSTAVGKKHQKNAQLVELLVTQLIPKTEIIATHVRSIGTCLEIVKLELPNVYYTALLNTNNHPETKITVQLDFLTFLVVLGMINLLFIPTLSVLDELKQQGQANITDHFLER